MSFFALIKNEFLNLFISFFILHNVNCILIEIDTVNASLQQFFNKDHHQAILPSLPEEYSFNINNRQIQQQYFKLLVATTSRQLPPYPSYLKPTDASWVAVNGTKYKFFLFSAFLDSRIKNDSIIRVIGATKRQNPDKVWCRYWYESNKDKKKLNGDGSRRRYVSHEARIRVINENWHLNYTSVFVDCPLLENQTVPKEVSIVAKVKSPPSNLLTVIDNYADSTSNKSDSKFVVCVKPLYDLNRVFKLIEFIELNRILGVDHFTFYNDTISPKIGCVLEDYVKRGLATVLPWRLDLVTKKEIRTEGLFSALNDCLYRSMYVYSYVVFIDFDEFIIPREDILTLPQLINHLDQTMSLGSIGAYSIRNAFFYRSWEDNYSIFDDVEGPIATALITLRKTRRRVGVHRHNCRSKYICRPETVVEAGNHFVWEFVQDYRALRTPPSVVMLHHYRLCERGGRKCIQYESAVDTTVYKYKTQLIGAVRERFNFLKQKCHL